MVNETISGTKRRRNLVFEVGVVLARKWVRKSAERLEESEVDRKNDNEGQVKAKQENSRSKSIF